MLNLAQASPSSQLGVRVRGSPGPTPPTAPAPPSLECVMGGVGAPSNQAADPRVVHTLSLPLSTPAAKPATFPHGEQSPRKFLC